MQTGCKSGLDLWAGGRKLHCRCQREMARSTILEPGFAAWALVLRLDHLTITGRTRANFGHDWAPIRLDDRTFVNSFMSPGLKKKCLAEKVAASRPATDLSE